MDWLWQTDRQTDELTSQITDYVKQSFLKSNSFAANWEILCIFWNLKVCVWVYKSLQLVLILSQNSPVHALPTDIYLSSTVIFPFDLHLEVLNER